MQLSMSSAGAGACFVVVLNLAVGYVMSSESPPSPALEFQTATAPPDVAGAFLGDYVPRSASAAPLALEITSQSQSPNNQNEDVLDGWVTLGEVKVSVSGSIKGSGRIKLVGKIGSVTYTFRATHSVNDQGTTVLNGRKYRIKDSSQVLERGKFWAQRLEKPEAPLDRALAGSLALPPGCPLSPSGLVVRSVVDTAPLDNAGHFSGLYVIDAGLPQFLFIKDVDGNRIGIAYVPVDRLRSGRTDMTTEDLALGLVQANPYVTVLDPRYAQEQVDAVRAHPEFSVLVADVEHSLVSSPENALDDETFPYIFERAVRIGLEVLDDMAEERGAAPGDLVMQGIIGRPIDPHLEGVSANSTKLVNPRVTFYGIRIDGERDSLMRGRAGLFQILPPGFADPEVRTEMLGRGRHEVEFFKGFNWDQEDWLRYSSAPGKATYANGAKALFIGLKFAGAGFGLKLSGLEALIPNDEQIEWLLARDGELTTLRRFMEDLAQAVNESVDFYDLVFDRLLPLIADHWDDISYFVWQEFCSGPQPRRLCDPDSALGLLESMGDWREVMGTVLTWVNILTVFWDDFNTWGPFLYDLAAAPSHPEYSFEVLRDGQLRLLTARVPPRPSFTVTPAYANVGQTVLFDARGTSDDRDPPEAILVRWDFDGDGFFDTEWESTKTTEYQYSSRGIYRVRLQARDGDGLEASTVRTAVVGAFNVPKIVLTWGAEPRDLDSHVFTPAIEGSTYHVYWQMKGSQVTPPYAWLDLDDITSYGPETVWIERAFDGVYHYCVHNYSDDADIRVSRAHVEVIGERGRLASFDVPPAGEGRWWRVFDYEPLTGRVYPIDVIADDCIAESPGNLGGAARELTDLPRKRGVSTDASENMR